MTDAQLDQLVPQVAIEVMDTPGPNGTVREVMMMLVETGATRFQFYLCDATNYVDTANKIAEGIMVAGRNMKKPSGLIAVKGGLPDAIHTRNGRRK